MQHIILIGPMCTGKSTTGNKVAKLLRLPFYDTDTLVTHIANISIKEIFARFGESHFRKLEFDALKQLKNKPKGIVACGGGIVVAPKNRIYLREMGHIIYLITQEHIRQQRLAKTENIASRPLLYSNSYREKDSFKQRRKYYISLATSLFHITEKNMQHHCEQLKKLSLNLCS